jgi:O-antigen/teichoic acid export membrane protein
MLATVKKLARLSAVYVIGDLITRGAAFLLLPLYTLFLSPDDYGIIAVTAMIGMVLSVLLTFGMTGTILRFYHILPDDRQRQRFYGAVWMFLIVVSGLATLLLVQFGEPLFALLFRQIPFDPYIRLVLWTTFFNAAFALLPPTLFRAREQAGRYVSFSLFTFATTTGLTIWLVVIQQQGALGMIRAQFGSALLMALVAAAVLVRELRPSFHWGQLHPALVYGIPLIPHFLAHWALGVSDRAILERYVDLGQLGVYSLGYQFGLLYQMVNTSLNNALIPMFSRAATDVAEWRMLPRVATYYVLAIATIGLALALLAGDVIVLALPPAYHDARTIVPWVVLGYLAMGLYYLPTNTLTLIAGKTRAVALVTTTAAAANIGLNLLLIPYWGVMAAALNTALGYAILSGFMFWRAQRIKPLAYEYQRFAKLALALLGFMVVGQALMQFHPLINLGIGIGLLAFLPLALAGLDFWTADEKRQFVGLSRQFRLEMARKGLWR